MTELQRSPADQAALDSLAAAARRDLQMIGDEPADWAGRTPGIDHNVMIVGAGQSGLAISLALRRAGIGGVTLIDAAEGAATGIWRATARMSVLRTPKAPPGPELGLPSLSFQAWYEAGFGTEAYAALGQIPREIWADYLDWFRGAADIPVRGNHRLIRIEPAQAHFRLHLDSSEGVTIETARKLVLSTGVGGSGGPFVPDIITEALPKSLYAHTHEAIDFAALRGKRIAILGSAASAFDAAGAALEAGAATVRLFCRGADIARSSATKGFSYPGAWEHFHTLPNAMRWRLMSTFRRRATFPPIPAVKRAVAFANFHIHLGAGWKSVRAVDGGVRIATIADEVFDVDYVIAGTGYRNDVRRDPAFRDFAQSIACWSDRVPAAAAEDPALAAAPYLGPGFELTPRQAGSAPFLADIHFMGFSAMNSHGRPVGDIASFRHNVPRLVSAIGRDLFLADEAIHVARFLAPAADDLAGELYASAVHRR